MERKYHNVEGENESKKINAKYDQQSYTRGSKINARGDKQLEDRSRGVCCAWHRQARLEVPDCNRRPEVSLSHLLQVD